MLDGENNFDLIIVGCGPAGAGIVVKLLKAYTKDYLLKQRIAIIEKSADLILGSITNYKVNSDTYSEVFLECLKDGFFDSNLLADELSLIKEYSGKAIPLYLLESYFRKLSLELKLKIFERNNFRLYLETIVSKVVIHSDGQFEVHNEGNNDVLLTKQLVIASGGKPILFDKELSFANKFPLRKYFNKLIHSNEILNGNFPPNLQTKLSPQFRIVILGGNHSAFSVAKYLLDNFNFSDSTENQIQIWARKEPKVYFNSKEEAYAKNYYNFNASDICSITNKVFRLAGLRMDGRNLFMKMKGLDSEVIERRVSFNLFTEDFEEIESALDSADIIVASFGYQFNMPLFFDAKGIVISFLGTDTKHWVDRNCNVLNSIGDAIPNLFAVGLASGFVPKGQLGGESSFEGQTNGIWYYQNVIADLITEKIVDAHTSNLS